MLQIAWIMLQLKINEHLRKVAWKRKSNRTRKNTLKAWL